MKLVDFIQGRNVKYGTVFQYIKRHMDIFAGHTGRSKGKIELDEFAVIELNKAYPFPKPIEDFVNTEVSNALIQAQQKVIELQEQLNNVLPFLAEAKYKKYLLEEETKRADNAEKQIKEEILKTFEKDIELKSEIQVTEFLKSKLDEQEETINDKNKKITNLEAEIEMLKNRNFMERIFNKEKEVKVEYKNNKYDKLIKSLLDTEIEKIRGKGK